MANILIVDDNPDARECLENIFSNDGHSVILANGGLEALKILSNNSDIDIVLLDCDMPQKNGYFTSKEIKTGETYQKKPILIGTGNFPENTTSYLDEIVDKKKILREINNICDKYKLQ